MEVLFKRIHPNATIPKQATEFAAGWDVTATEIEFSHVTDLVICKLGFAIKIPDGYRFVIVPRSSLTNTHWIIQNSPAVGDSDFTGEYQVRFKCIRKNKVDLNKGQIVYDNFPYNIGDRIAQIYLEAVIPIEFTEVYNLPETKRGSGAYGSTGK